MGLLIKNIENVERTYEGIASKQAGKVRFKVNFSPSYVLPSIKHEIWNLSSSIDEISEIFESMEENSHRHVKMTAKPGAESCEEGKLTEREAMVLKIKKKELIKL